MKNDLRKEIKENLKTSLNKYISKFVYKSSQPLDLLIPKERKIRSIVGGLETSMGTTVWEPIARAFAKNNNFKLIESKILRPHPFPKKLAEELSSFINLRENKHTWISARECVKRFRDTCKKIDRLNINYVSPPPGTGVDIYLEKDGTEYAFDIKTVQPNVGSIKSFNKQILEWYAYRLCKNPEVNIRCKIAYPYNPYSNDFWMHSIHASGILEPKVDAVVENEFWDFLSGFDNTYAYIIKIFKELNSEGLGKELSTLIEKIYTSTEKK